MSIIWQSDRAEHRPQAWRHIADNRIPIPVDVQDAVEVWFRQWGRHARIEINAAMQTPCLKVERFANDPARQVEEEELHLLYSDTEYRTITTAGGRPVRLPAPLPVWQMSGPQMTDWLNEHNRWGPGGMTLEKEIERVEEHNRALVSKVAKSATELTKEILWERRTEIAPRVPTGIDLRGESNEGQ